MDLSILHTFMEVCVTACLFYLSWINAENRSRGKYSTVLCVGTFIVGLANMAHIVYSIILVPTHSFDITMLNSAAQLTLLAALAMVYVCPKTCEKYKYLLGIILILPSIISGLLDSYHITHERLLIFQPIDVFNLFTMHYPCYFMTGVAWCIVATGVYRKRSYLFPPYSFAAFAGYIIVANFISAFVPYQHSTETLNLMVHALKLAGIYTVVLMYLISNYRRNTCPIINTRTDYTLKRYDDYSPPKQD